jgi:crossover junction endodeoxyribonuclease RuvC
MRIIGIDPGTAITGYSILDKEGNRLKAVKYGCIYTESSWPLSKRLDKIYSEVTNLIHEYKPGHLAVEELFFNTNAKTALSVGHSRGVILLAGEQNNLIVEGYTPLQVKQAIAGYGRAEKSQVQKMVKTILCLDEIPKPDDAADALAVAICHSQSYSIKSIVRGIK